MLNRELLGPKVRIEKLGTADRGGGQLVAQADVLMVRGKLRSRTLGPLQALQAVRFDTPDGLRAEAVFSDLSRWFIETEDQGLLDFAHQLQAQLGRADLVSDPPRLSQHVRTVMGSQAKRRAAEAIVALALAPAAFWLVSRAAPLGWLIVGAALGWVSALGIALFQAEPSGAFERARATFERHGWALTLLLPLGLAFGAALGMQTAEQRALSLQQHTALRAEAAQRAQAKAEEEAAQARRRHLQQATRADRLQTELNAQRWPEAKRAYDELAEIEPNHPALPPAWATLGPQLDALAEAQQQGAIAQAFRDAKRMSSDAVVCDDARAVAATWKVFRELPPTDPRREAAAKLVPALERCRTVVARSLAANATEQRSQARMRLALRIQDELRRAGHLVNVTLEGKLEDLVRIAGDGLDAKAVHTITGGERTATSVLGRLEAEGVRTVELYAGRRKLDRVQLRPLSAAALAEELLASMGLAEPLSLPTAEPITGAH